MNSRRFDRACRHLAGAVDYVFVANAFLGVPDKPRLARVVHNVLKRGGLFAVFKS
jgi:hypothetical protein